MIVELAYCVASVEIRTIAWKDPGRVKGSLRIEGCATRPYQNLF